MYHNGEFHSVLAGELVSVECRVTACYTEVIDI